MRLEKVDTTKFNRQAVAFFALVQKLDVIPPRHGSGEYERKKYRYVTGENSSVMLAEKTANLVKLLAENPEMKYWEAVIRAGYLVETTFSGATSVSAIKKDLNHAGKRYMIKDAIKFLNYLKNGAAEELLIDAQWVLAESVNLYEECRREKAYTQAARILENISTHTAVDAKVSNRLIVEGQVDYAAILEQANNRLELSNPNIVDAEFKVLAPVAKPAQSEDVLVASDDS